MKNAIDDAMKIINGTPLAQQNQWIRKQPHSHSMINSAEKHNAINRLACDLPVNTMQDTMIRNLGNCSARVTGRTALFD